MRCIEFDFAERGGKVRCELFDNTAPNSCNALWDALETPINKRCEHGIYSGQVIGFLTDFSYPELENTRIIGLKNGDILLNTYSTTKLEKYCEIVLVYGDEILPCDRAGQARWNHIGHVVPEDAAKLTEIGLRIMDKGREDVTVRRG